MKENNVNKFLQSQFYKYEYQKRILLYSVTVYYNFLHKFFIIHTPSFLSRNLHPPQPSTPIKQYLFMISIKTKIWKKNKYNFVIIFNQLPKKRRLSIRECLFGLLKWGFKGNKVISIISWFFFVKSKMSIRIGRCLWNDLLQNYKR